MILDDEKKDDTVDEHGDEEHVEDDDGVEYVEEESPGLEDPDRLPWLETGEHYEVEGNSPWRTVGLVIGLLILLGLVVGGLYWFQNKDSFKSFDDVFGSLSEGSGEVIEAPEDDYKVEPEDAEGREFEGEGDVAHATAEGRADTTTGAVKPEAKQAAASAGGALVQLGALGDKASAEQLWKELTGRYGYLGDYKQAIKTATIEGRTVYRLNAVASDKAAADKLCDRLKGDGASCLVR